MGGPVPPAHGSSGLAVRMAGAPADARAPRRGLGARRLAADLRDDQRGHRNGRPHPEALDGAARGRRVRPRPAHFAQAHGHPDRKAKKFGPQQLGFPQKGFSFPQAPFFAPRSKGPLPALEAVPKGPIVAPENSPAAPQPIANTSSCTSVQTAHRQYKPERKQTESRPIRLYPIPYGPDRRTLREMEVRAELRVGAGPEIHRE